MEWKTTGVLGTKSGWGDSNRREKERERVNMITDGILKTAWGLTVMLKVRGIKRNQEYRKREWENYEC